MARRSLSPQQRSRGVTAVLGPTNTGKTHLAIERMLGHDSGMIGLPLRLLAREVYQRVVEKAGVNNVALVTGEEKIKPERPRYWISTVEAMPRDLDVSFVAVDEIQLAADLDRGHVFTDRLLNQRGRSETLLIGSGTMRPLVEALLPGVHVVTRPRLSKLTFAGEKKLSRLPPRTAIVAFSAEEVYAIAELIRRQRGGAAVVLGALSPRTRNAQVDLYQSGDVQYLIATDAVGMGLNLDVDHVAFAGSAKFDGVRFRKLYPPEIGQIAGRAGRHLRDGTFGTTGRCPPFDAELIEQLESHQFEPVKVLQWRNPDLEFSSVAKLQESLAEQPRDLGLLRAPMAEDVAALEIVSRDEEVRGLARGRAAVERLWDVCQVPDYRKVSPATHADLVSQLYRFLMQDGVVRPDWFARHVALLDRVEGDIDTLSNRIAQVRTWTFVANRPDWLADPEHWQGVTRQVEDRLSDALHERLAQRFVDRRTSVLMRRLRENAMLEADITATGDVTVEGQHVGHLHGFQFVPDPLAGGEEAKTLRNAAAKALAGEIDARAERFSLAPDTSLVLSNDGTIRWQGDPVAKLEPGDKLYEPKLRLLADEQLTGPSRDKVETRLKAWLKAHVVRLLGPALHLEEAPELSGLARGIGFQVAEALGVLERSRVLQEVRGLDQEGRASLRKLGLRFGAYHLYLPALLKPGPRTLAAQLWALRNGGLDQKGLDEIAHLAASGRTSIPVDTEIAKGLYRAAGFRVCGGRAVRVDILERLADQIRPAIAYRPGVTPGEPPPGAADGEGFVPTVTMTSLVGCSGEDFASILRSLGYVSDRRPGPAITVPLVAAPAPIVPPTAVQTAPDVAAEAAADVPATDGATDATAGADLSAVAHGQVDDAATAEPVAGPDGGDAVETAEATPASDGADPAAEPTPVPDSDVAAAPALVETAAEEAAVTAELAVEMAAASDAVAAASVEPAAAEPSADAPALDAPAPEMPSAEVAAPAEAELLEVWRQGRHPREAGQQPRRGRQDRRERRADGGRPQGERGPRDGQRPDGGRPQDGERRQDGSRGPRPDRGPGQRPQGPRPEHRAPEQRADGPRPDRPPRDERGAQGGRPERDPNRPPRGDRAPRPDRGQDRPREWSNQGAGRRDERRERQPDPDSPFAKLLALKEQLQSRDKR
ncbi:MAG TPA: helicase-related protein [Beijerinckiaceae bacterium]|jgi:ATP-dependent RNA helicase SUPV3L1/SUV3